MPRRVLRWRMRCSDCRICWPTKPLAVASVDRPTGGPRAGVEARAGRAAANRLALRPRLSFAGQPTGPDASLDRTLAALAAVPLEPVPLDPVSVADDPGYANALQAQKNLDPAMKEALKVFYPIE